MSKGWAGGSSRAWRALRLQVLERDGYRCKLGLAGCTRGATQVHHLVTVASVGKVCDPLLLVAACKRCNLTLGEPKGDPRPRGRTRW